ncbi:uncharacterized protein LOC113334527 [Papaver somniferum]|uniref:uncharacterized protein LOC113334527 n=1 Tax=Papaver somniferum TaxID=3469 RepID=UPI000E6FEF87|nr:uncharacterized protein LOC113334527 [Papaver somniferum]
MGDQILQEIGTPLKIDNATARCEVGYYANVLVEVDFSQHTPSKVWIGTKYEGFFQDVMIPNCPKFCSSCKIVGHLNSECKFKKNTEQEKPVESIPKNDHRRETQVPFDIYNPVIPEDSVVDSIKDVIQTNSSNVETISQGSKFNALKNVPQEEILEEVIMETPKIVKVVEANTLNSSTVKFINGTNGKVKRFQYKLLLGIK